jgi:hypothetical protein
MAKKSLNEGLVTKAMVGIWNALLQNKKAVLMKKLQNDPEFQKNLEELDELRKKMEARLEQKRKTLPGFKEREQDYLGLFKK